jgi:hypothetical protein
LRSFINVIKEELPEEQESFFWAFNLSAAQYTVLRLALEKSERRVGRERSP